jgi:hypothetical protein
LVPAQGAVVKKHCEDGFDLCKQFENSLKEWGFADVNSHAVQIMPLDPEQLKARARKAKEAESTLCKARYAYINHLAHCLICSGKLVSSDSSHLSPDLTTSPVRPQFNNGDSSRPGLSGKDSQNV